MATLGSFMFMFMLRNSTLLYPVLLRIQYEVGMPQSILPRFGFGKWDVIDPRTAKATIALYKPSVV